MEVNAQLFVDAELDDHVVQEAAVDVVVQVLDGHFDLGRIADVIFVNLKQTSKSKSKLWTILSTSWAPRRCPGLFHNFIVKKSSADWSKGQRQKN